MAVDLGTHAAATAAAAVDDRIAEFVRGLRAAGVRVSLAEGIDGLRAARAAGVEQRERFRRALRASLIKDRTDIEAFETLFPFYFGGEPPLQDGRRDLDPEEEDLLRAALSALAGRARDLLDWLTGGEGPSREELEAMARRAAELSDNPRHAQFVSRRMLDRLGFGELEKLLDQLRQQLEALGMRDDLVDQLIGVAEANRDAIEEGMARRVGLEMARRRAERPPAAPGGDMMDRPLQDLSRVEAEAMRQEVRRLVARLRSRAALRQKRARRGRPDPRKTLRANQRYGGVPIDLLRRRRRLKPSLVLICDVSTSMRPVAEFMLRLIYELSDQVARARSFAFNDDLREITHLLSGSHIAEAVSDVLYAIPPGYYATDLGNSLATFDEHFRDALDHRTTLIVLGDGRNNYNDPRLDLLRALQRRAKRLVWLNPEAPAQWGSGDSDMRAYAPLCDAVYPVRNLGQLAAAVDRLLAG